MLFDLDVLWTVTDAAEHAGVKPATIRTWVFRGLLPVAERNANGELRFHPLDVARAEHHTRARARRVIAA